MSFPQEILTTIAYSVGWQAVRALPEPMVQKLFRYGANRAYRKNGRSVQQLRRNLRQVVGPQYSSDLLEKLVAEGVGSYARYWLEAFRLPTWSRQQIINRFVLHGAERLNKIYAAGRGAVLALPHAGNYDHAGAWVCAQGMRLVTVAERLKPEGLYQRFLRYRQSLGMEILPYSGGTQSTIEVLADRLRAGHLVALLADRDLSTKGVEVSFFGARTRMPPGPALLALRTGAPLLPVSLGYGKDHSYAYLGEPILAPTSGDLPTKIRTMTQSLAEKFQIGISENPQDWHMMQRVWLSERSSIPESRPKEAGI